MNKQTIIITGASDGIGKALAWEMAERGYNLGLMARRESALADLQGAIRARFSGCQVEVQPLDVTDYDQVQPAIDALIEKLGGMDILVANAGIARAGKVGKLDLRDHLQVIDTNVNGAIATIDAGLRYFRKQGRGQIVGTSSVAAFRGLPGNAAYCASKAALSTFLEALRAETRRDNIDITILHPGFIDTALNRNMPSRPFVIDVKKGARIFADLVERKVARSTVPPMPWRIVGPLLKHLPTALIARM